VSCEECEKAREIDGDIPDCETDKGCVIPRLGERGGRIMAIREKLMKLKDLVDPGTILAAYGATIEDLDLLAKVEELMSVASPK
jgi:hypothetical protein